MPQFSNAYINNDNQVQIENSLCQKKYDGDKNDILKLSDKRKHKEETPN